MENSFERTHERYQAALSDALDQFRALFTSSHSKQWKPIPPHPVQPSTHPDPAQMPPRNGLGPIDFSNVQVHRRKAPGAPVVRAVSDIWIDPARAHVDDFNAVLNTPEVRGVWDKLVDKARVVQVLEPNTRIVKTDFRLGWPANPRDAITITKTFHDANTIIDISTSLPASSAEPAYLRPSPPFVRSHIHLLAWCIQLAPPPTPLHPHASLPTAASAAPDPSGSAHGISLEEIPPSEPMKHSRSTLTRARITVFWKVNWKGAIFSTHHSQIASLLGSFVEYMRAHADRIPLLSFYGKGIDFGSTAFDKSEEKLTVEYSIVMIEGSAENPESAATSLDRAVELKLPMNQGWNVHVHVNLNGQPEGAQQSWSTTAEKDPSCPRTTLRISHAPLTGPHQIVKIRVTAQRLAGGNALRVNQKSIKPVTVDVRIPSAPQSPLIDDTASISNLSLQTTSTDISKLPSDKLSVTSTSLSSSPPTRPATPTCKRPNPTNRINVLSSLIRRSYIYFSSLLQEPEAKWKHITDSRGVTVTQLQSIDPTLTVYRAEATFVGVGVWNVYSAISSVGARQAWDPTLADAVLLEDLNDLSSLWQIKQSSTWPVAPRDAVLITTTYKSPSAVHIFSVSTDDAQLFPSILPPDPGAIRTRTEILGWSIEALSPTTTQITLIDQHDPMGWSPKSWTPARLIAQVASVGEYALKSGGPPIITRVLGAKVKLSKYEHDKGIFRAEYSTSDGALSAAMQDPSCDGSTLDVSVVECEVRCDCETWAASLDIVVNPPPTKATCLKRHKLSSGGGWWVMIEHDTSLLADDTARISIRRGTSSAKEKGLVTLNGTSLRVDVEELSEDEAARLAKRRRMKASLIPLDQYSLSGPRLWRNSPFVSPPTTRSATPVPDKPDKEPRSNTPLSTSPATVSPICQSGSPPAVPPMVCALEALARLQAFHIEQGPDIMIPPAGWTLVAEKGTSSVYKKIVPQVSEVFPVYRGDRVIEGVTAEEMVSALSACSARPMWDDRIETSCPLESYGHGCSTMVLTTKPTFPFKGRLLQLAQVNAQMQMPSSSVTSSTTTVHFIATTSFSRPADSAFPNAKINPQGLVEGNVLLEGWIMETIDPYSVSFHAIPSTRCTYFSAIDYRGSVPVAFNSILNSSLPKIISGVEKLVKAHGPLPKLCRPALTLQVDGALDANGMSDWQWRIQSGIEPKTVAIVADANGSAVFRAIVLVPKEANEPLSATAGAPTLSPAGSNTTVNASRYDVVRQLRGMSSNASEPVKPKEARRLVSNPDLRIKAGIGGHGRRAAGPSTHTLNGSNGCQPGDLVVTEITLDRKLYPFGFRIVWTTSFVKENATVGLEKTVKALGIHNQEPLSSLLSSSDQQPDLPIDVSIHEMPSPAVFAASLDPGAKREHLLLRMTLPVASIHSPIRDPLTSSEVAEVKVPAWYTQLSKRNALVRISMEPIGLSDADGQDLQDGPVFIRPLKQVEVNGKMCRVVPLLESQSELDRWEIDDYSFMPCSISRMTRTTKQSPNTTVPATTFPSDKALEVLPLILQRPSAVVEEFFTQSNSGPLSPLIMGTSAVSSPEILSPVLEQTETIEELGKTCQKSAGSLLQQQAGNGSAYMRPGTFFSPLVMSLFTISPFTKLAKPLWKTLTKPRTYTTRHIILTAIIFFLLGSLLRSLLVPSDFIIVAPPRMHDDDESSRFLQFLGTKHKLRELVRLVEVRLFCLKEWGIVLAAVRIHAR